MLQVIRHHAPAGVLPLLFSEILLMGGCFFAAGALLYPPDPAMYFLYEGGLERTVLAMATIFTALYFFDFYSDIQVRSRVLLMQELCLAMGVALLAESMIQYAFRDYVLPPYLLLDGGALTLATLFLWRLLYCSVLLRSLGRERVLFVGRNATIEDVASEIASDPTSGYEILGVLDDGEAPAVSFADAPVLGPLSALKRVAAERKPARIVVGLSERREQMPVAELLELRFAGRRIEEASTTYEAVYRRVCSRDVSPLDVIFRGQMVPPANTLRMAQTLSGLEAAALALCALPLIVALAVVLRLTSKKPVLVRLPRVGKDGRVFELLRYREAPELGGLYLHLRMAAMPELWNVMRGDMALVGPRPASLDHAAASARAMPLYEYRHNVRPGITGWAQIHSSSYGPEDPLRQLEYDLYYIKHMSQALNAYILLNTFKNRVLRVGAATP